MGERIDSVQDGGGALDRLVVIVAARNESERIGATLAALASAFPDASLWVSDDASRDDTASLARAAGAHVVTQPRSLGKGGAVSRTARAALAQQEDWAIVLLCDGDLADSAARLGALVAEVRQGRADLAVARFATSLGGGFGVALSFARWAIERRCGARMQAPISGQRALSRDTLAAVLPFAAGYGMEIGMTIDALRAGRRVSEIELDLAHRASGRTPAGFAHRARQLVDFARVYLARR